LGFRRSTFFWTADFSLHLVRSRCYEGVGVHSGPKISGLRTSDFGFAIVSLTCLLLAAGIDEVNRFVHDKISRFELLRGK